MWSSSSPEQELVMKTTEDSNTLVFMKDIKDEVSTSMKKLYNTDMAQVNTLIRADGGKAYVQQAPHYNALDIANKPEIISCLISK